MLTWQIGARTSLMSSAPCCGGTSRRRFPGSATPDAPRVRRAARASAIIPDGARGSAPFAGRRNGYAQPARACDGCGGCDDGMHHYDDPPTCIESRRGSQGAKLWPNLKPTSSVPNRIGHDHVLPLDPLPGLAEG
jgi:hypothetical protein